MWTAVLYAYMDKTVKAEKFFKIISSQAINQLPSLKASVLMFKSSI